MNCHSAGSSGPGFSRIASGIALADVVQGRCLADLQAFDL
jgi:hypothetical protein